METYSMMLACEGDWDVVTGPVLERLSAYRKGRHLPDVATQMVHPDFIWRDGLREDELPERVVEILDLYDDLVWTLMWGDYCGKA